MRVNVGRVAGIVAVLALGGCSTGVFIQDDPMQDAVGQFAVGTHTRAQVVALLGEPFASAPERGVDVFQRTGELIDVMLPGIPYTTEQTYYTLISYDASGRLTGIDSGGHVYRSTLEADRFRYKMGAYGMLLEQERRPAYGTRGPGCTLVLLLGGNRWSDRLYYQAPVHLNGAELEVRADYSSYLYWSIDPGPQSLSVKWSGWNGPWSSDQDFECAAGELLYVMLTGDRNGEPIAVGRDVPAALQGRALVVYPPPTAAPLLPLE